MQVPVNPCSQMLVAYSSNANTFQAESIRRSLPAIVFPLPWQPHDTSKPHNTPQMNATSPQTSNVQRDEPVQVQPVREDEPEDPWKRARSAFLVTMVMVLLSPLVYA
uniref:Uncharacterized protein n=1 Tax=Alexandrium andersonii TaxID=327968 RepID=A0A7S2C6R1_9DINO